MGFPKITGDLGFFKFPSGLRKLLDLTKKYSSRVTVIMIFSAEK